MFNFFLALLRIRTIIILAIIYFFLNISSNGKLSLQLPKLQNISVENLTNGLQNTKNQIANLFGKQDSKNNQENNKSNQEDNKSDNLEGIKKSINDFLNSDKSKN